MPYSIRTDDGIQIDNIPDNILQDADVLRERVEKARQERNKSQPSGVFQTQTQTQQPTQPTGDKKYAGFFESTFGALGDYFDIASVGSSALLPGGETTDEAARRFLKESETKPARSRFSFADIEKAWSEGGMEGLKETIQQMPGGLGEAMGMIGPSIAAGAAGFALGGPLGAILAIAASSAAPQMGGNVVEQATADLEAGRPLDVENAKALVALVPQVALDIVPFKLGALGKLVGLSKKLPAGALRKKIAAEGLGKATAKNFVSIVGHEVPTEIGQEIITKVQAGVDPFTEEAIAEYKELGAIVFFTGGLAPFTAYTSRKQARDAINQDKEETPPTKVPPTGVLPTDVPLVDKGKLVDDKKKIKFDKESAAALATANIIAENINKLNLKNADIIAQDIPNFENVNFNANKQEIDFLLGKISEQNFTTREFAEEALRGQLNFNPSFKGLLQVQENEDGTFSIVALQEATEKATKAIIRAIADDEKDKAKEIAEKKLEKAEAAQRKKDKKQIDKANKEVAKGNEGAAAVIANEITKEDEAVDVAKKELKNIKATTAAEVEKEKTIDEIEKIVFDNMVAAREMNEGLTEADIKRWGQSFEDKKAAEAAPAEEKPEAVVEREKFEENQKKWARKTQTRYQEGQKDYRGNPTTPGELIRFYHATSASDDYNTFKPGGRGNAIYISPSREEAQSIGYAQTIYPSPGIKSGSRVLPVYARVENAWDYENADDVNKLYSAILKQKGIDEAERFKKGINEGIYQATEDNTDIIQQLGYDGFYIQEGPKIDFRGVVVSEATGVKNLGVFNPNQLKSVYNKGTFSTKNDDIYDNIPSTQAVSSETFIDDGTLLPGKSIVEEETNLRLYPIGANTSIQGKTAQALGEVQEGYERTQVDSANVVTGVYDKDYFDADKKKTATKGDPIIEQVPLFRDNEVKVKVVQERIKLSPEEAKIKEDKRTTKQKEADKAQIDIYNKLEETKGNIDTDYAGLDEQGNIKPPSKSDIRSSFAPILSQMEKHDKKQKLIQDKVTASAIYIGNKKGVDKAKDSLAEYVLGDKASTSQKNKFFNENYAIRQLYESRRDVPKNYLDLKGGDKEVPASIKKSHLAITPRQKVLNLDAGTLEPIVQRDIGNSILSKENVKNLYAKGVTINNYKGAIPTVKNILKTNLIPSQFAAIPEKTFKDIARHIISANAYEIDAPMVKKETDKRIKEFDKSEKNSAIKDIKNISLEFKRNDPESNWEIPQFLKTGAVFGSAETVYETAFLDNPVVVNANGWLRIVYQEYTYEQAADNLISGATEFKDDRGLYPEPKKVLKERQKLRDEFINSAIMKTYIKAYKLNPSQEIASFENYMARGNYIASNITTTGRVSDRVAKDMRKWVKAGEARIVKQVKREAAANKRLERTKSKIIEESTFDPKEKKDANRFTEDEVKDAIGKEITDRVDVETGLLSDESENPLTTIVASPNNMDESKRLELQSINTLKQVANRGYTPLTDEQLEAIVTSSTALVSDPSPLEISFTGYTPNPLYELGIAHNNYGVLSHDIYKIGQNLDWGIERFPHHSSMYKGKKFHHAIPQLLNNKELRRVWESETIGEAIEKAIPILENSLTRVDDLLARYSPSVHKKWIKNKDVKYRELGKIPAMITPQQNFEPEKLYKASGLLEDGTLEEITVIDAVPAGIGIIALSRRIESQIEILKAFKQVKNIDYMKISQSKKGAGGSGSYSHYQKPTREFDRVIVNESALGYNPSVLFDFLDMGLQVFIHEVGHAATVNALMLFPSKDNLEYSLEEFGIKGPNGNEKKWAIIENMHYYKKEGFSRKGSHTKDGDDHLYASLNDMKRLIEDEGSQLTSKFVATLEFRDKSGRRLNARQEKLKIEDLGLTKSEGFLKDPGVWSLIKESGIQSSEITMKLAEEINEQTDNKGVIQEFYTKLGTVPIGNGLTKDIYGIIHFLPIDYAQIPTTGDKQRSFYQSVEEAYIHGIMLDDIDQKRTSPSGIISRTQIAQMMGGKGNTSNIIGVYQRGTLSKERMQMNINLLKRARDVAKERNLQFYGLYSIKEYYAELQTNPVFVRFLASIEGVFTKKQIDELANPKTREGYDWVRKEVTKYFNLLQESLLMLGKMLGINVDNTLLSDSVAMASSLYTVGGSSRIILDSKWEYPITNEEFIRNSTLSDADIEAHRITPPSNWLGGNNFFGPGPDLMVRPDYMVDESFGDKVKKAIKKTKVKSQGKESINVATPIGNIVLKVTQKQLKELRTARKEREKSFAKEVKAKTTTEQLDKNRAKKNERRDNSHFKNFKNTIKNMFTEPNKFWEDIEIKYVNAKAPLRWWENNLRRTNMLKIGVEGFNDVYNQLVSVFGRADVLLKDYLYEPLQNYAQSLQSYIDIFEAENLGPGIESPKAEAEAAIGNLMQAQTAQERRKVLGWKYKPLSTIKSIQLPDGSITSPADMRNDIFKVTTTLDFQNKSQQERTAAIKKYREDLIILTDNNTKFSGVSSVDALGYSPNGTKSIDITSDEYNASTFTYAQEEKFIRLHEKLKKSNPKVYKAIEELLKAQSIVQKQTMKLNIMGNFTPIGAQNIIDLYDWNYYIPLKAEKLISDRDIDPNTTLLSTELKKLEASFTGSTVEPEDTFLQTIMDATAAANRAGRVKFTQAVYNAISTEVEYDQRDAITTPKKPRLLDGEIIERFSYNERYDKNTQSQIKNLLKKTNTILHLADNGDVIVMQINDERLSKAIRGEFKTRGLVVETANTVTGFMGQMHTRFNPPFAPLNLIRDAVTDFIYVSTDLGLSDGVGFANNIAQQLTKGAFQDTWKIAFMYTKGNIKGIEKLVTSEEKKGNMYPGEMMEYLTGGGIISFSQALSNDGAQKRLNKILNQGVLFKGRKAAVEFFDGYMGAFELATRVAAYTTFKGNYLAKNNAGPNPSKELLLAAQTEARVYAKRLSNFEEVGVNGVALGGYFMFFRPSAVGAARAFESFGVMFQDINTAARDLPDYIRQDNTRYKAWEADFNKRKSAAQTSTASLLGFGATIFALSVLLSGDDEDRRNKTLNDDMQRWSRFMRFDISAITGNKDDVFQFPWGFGPGGFAAIGAQMAGLFTARENTPGSVLGNILAIGMDSFLPLPFSRMNPLDEPLPFAFDTMAPSAIRPLIEWTWNKNAFGQQIYRARSRGYGSAYISGDNIHDSYKDTSAWLLENTGINWTPNSVHFFLNNYVDGLSKILSNLYSMGLLAAGDKNFNPKTDIPGAFLHSFISRYSKVDQRAYGRITEELSELENDLKIFQIANPELYLDYVARNPLVPTIVTRYNELKASLNKLNKVANDMRQSRRLTPKQREDNLKPIKEMQIIIKKNIVNEMESLLKLNE